MAVKIYIWAPVFAKQKFCLSISYTVIKNSFQGATEDGMVE